MSVSEALLAPAGPGGSQAESVTLILSGQRSIADLTLLLGVNRQVLECVADAESHRSACYWKALECCSRAKCVPNPRAKLAFCELK